MAKARCLTCRQTVYWNATRGNKLADQRCACGGKLSGATEGRRSTAGRKMEPCAACGRRVWDRRLVSIPVASAFLAQIRNHCPEPSPLPVGSRVCGRHEVLPLRRVEGNYLSARQLASSGAPPLGSGGAERGGTMGERCRGCGCEVGHDQRCPRAANRRESKRELGAPLAGFPDWVQPAQPDAPSSPQPERGG